MNSYATAEVEHQKLQEASKHLNKNKDGSPRRKLLNPSTLKSEGVRDCEKVKEKLDRKYRRGLTFADFYDMITRFASCTSIGKNKAFCFLFLVPNYLKVNEVFKKVDINNDGYIDIEEFRKTLKSD